ncbi:rho guanine nucleotide exchange factor 12 isoform X2 [Brachyhypopomus gauderio]|uniref:rho guanine nucleotide exchange factor 12 isoform X2 n=1 Tax=Brachyhypopomus gauderio TaxID=698409 RepID=UPI0040429F13
MSDAQTPVSDRSSSVLSRDHPAEKRPKSDKPTTAPAHEFDSTGLVQRCVIIQRDANGFGLTVSGDNPVFVQLVKEDGAAMRAGVQTGDRIIKVNGTLVTQSNHVEVVKLIKSGSYVALTVLGRPPGSPQVPLSEVDLNLGSLEGHASPLTPSPHASRPRPGSRVYKTAKHDASPAAPWEHNRNPTPKLLKDNQAQLSRTAQYGMYIGPCEDEDVVDVDRPDSDGSWSSVRRAGGAGSPDGLHPRDSSSLKRMCRKSPASCPTPMAEDPASLVRLITPPPSAGSAPPPPASHIIGAEDDYFQSEQEQVPGQRGCFQSVELLKSRPAHLAAFLHHVVSQFDPAPVLCYLYTELYQHTNSKESRRVFMDFLTFFLERGANLKVAVPESISSELERRRPELIPEDFHRRYVQMMQDVVLPDVQKLLEDFRQKRSIGLSAAEDELDQLPTGPAGSPDGLEQERSCAESILSKIDDVLLPLQNTDEDKCATVQYVISTYMKRLGVSREPRGLESKRMRINFLPKIKKVGKPEKEGEEKVKKPRFNILGPPRRPSRLDPASAGRILDASKQRNPKQLPLVAVGGSEPVDGGRLRGSPSGETSDLTHTPAHLASPGYSAPYGPATDTPVRDPDYGGSPSSGVQRSSEGVHTGETLDYPPCDYPPYGLEQLYEEADRLDEVLSEDDGGSGGGGGALYSDVAPPSWQQLVGREVLAGLTPHEIKRQEVINGNISKQKQEVINGNISKQKQEVINGNIPKQKQEVINELFYTERAHTRMLKVLDTVFYQKLTRDNILPPADIRTIFTNLDEIVQLHVTISEQMVAARRKNESSVVDQIGDDLLSWFGGGEEERMKQAVGTFCSNQPFALELIKQRQKKDQRFATFMQEAESNRLCRRLQLKDIIPAEMQRITKYPLLLENMAKYTDNAVEKDKVKKAADCCRKILNHVNQAVKEAENKQRLEEYQRRLDLSSLKQSENPLISPLKNLDLTKRKLVYEGPLTWKLNKDKSVELYTLLLEDVLVLLQKQDDRLVLKCHSKNRAGTVDTQLTFSPVIKLNTVLVRSVATDNRSFFVLSMSDNGAQIYELMAQTVSDQRLWQRHISQRAEVMKAKPHGVIALPQAPGERDGVEVCKDVKVSDATCAAHLISSGRRRSSGTPPLVRRSSAPVPSPSPSTKEQRAHKITQDDSSSSLELLDARDAELLSSACRAEEALKTLAALKQVLVTQLMMQDSGERLGRASGERLGRASGGRLLRTTSLRTPAPHSSGHSPCRSRDNTAGDTGFYEDSEDYGYLLLEGCGDSNTDDDVRCRAGVVGLAHSCAADSGISLRFSSTAGESLGHLSRQVLAHLRSLQANLDHLKEMESQYYSLVRRRHTEDGDSEDKN